MAGRCLFLLGSWLAGVRPIGLVWMTCVSRRPCCLMRVCHAEFDRLVDADEDSQQVWDSFYDRVHEFAASMTLERLVDWFVALHDPATILNVHYGVGWC